MIGHGTKFGRKKEEAIAALLSQRNIEEVARVTGIGTKTLLRWLQIPQFQDEYSKARREAVYQSVARIQQSTGAAGITILKLMTDPAVPAAVRLRAAECVLNHAVKAIELEDIESRVSELERTAESSKNSQRSSLNRTGNVCG